MNLIKVLVFFIFKENIYFSYQIKKSNVFPDNLTRMDEGYSQNDC